MAREVGELELGEAELELRGEGGVGGVYQLLGTWLVLV